MTLLDKIADTLGYRRKGAARSRAVESITNDIMYDTVDMSIVENQEAVFARSSWVHTAVSYIARSVASVPLNVLETKGEESEAVYNHPFEQLWRRPNAYMTKTELVQRLVVSYLLTGNAYLYLYAPRGKLTELWPLRSSRMTAAVNARDFISGYVYEVNAHKTPYEPLEIVHWAMPNPLSEVRGLSPIEVLQYTVSGDLSAQRYNVAFFKNAAMIPTIIAIKTPISDDDFAVLREEFKREHTGASQAHKVGFVRGSEIDVKPLGVTPKDMEFLNGRKFAREEIFQLYGIPMGIMSENATEANATVAEKLFKEQTLWPLLVAFAEKLTAEVMMPFYGDEYRCEFEDVRPTNKEQDLREMDVVSKYGIMTIDEVRARFYQLPPIAEVVTPPAPVEEPEPESESAETPEKPGEEEAEETEAEESVEAVEKPGEGEAMRADLRRWREKALRDVKQHGSVDRALQFDTLAIPPAEFTRILGGLARATSADAVRAVFAGKAGAPPPPDKADRDRHERAMQSVMLDFLSGQQGRVLEELRRGRRL